MPADFELTVLTPTTGKPSLDRLVDSIDQQTVSAKIFHILLWDDFRDADAREPASYDCVTRRSLVLLPGSGRNGAAVGSPLRAVGLMAAQTPWVTFADDDVTWDPDHAEALLAATQQWNWATTWRRMWSPEGDCLGVDRVESVGDEPTRIVPYEMCDNNVMIFRRQFGVAAAVLYRETTQYNDDRLMYAFLKQRAGPRGRTGRATVNHVCPPRLADFFRTNCSAS